jgi:hypothetical protein
MSGPTQAQHRRMHVYWRKADVTDRADRLALTSAIVGRPLNSSSEMTEDEAVWVIHYLRDLDDSGSLAVKADAWLAAQHRNASAFATSQKSEQNRVQP